MPALVVPAVATTPITSRTARIVAQGGPQRVAGEAMVARGHGERPDTEHVTGLAHRGVGVLAHGDERPRRCLRPAAMCRGVAGDHQG